MNKIKTILIALMIISIVILDGLVIDIMNISDKKTSNEVITILENKQLIAKNKELRNNVDNFFNSTFKDTFK